MVSSKSVQLPVYSTKTLGKIGIVVPSKDRHLMLRQHLDQWSEDLGVIVVVDSSEMPLEGVDRYPNLLYEHVDIPLHEARQFGINLVRNLYPHVNYICEVDDDTFIKNHGQLLTLCKLLDNNEKVWIVGGMGGFTSSWAHKTYKGPYYATWCSNAYLTMFRHDISIKYKFAGREDLVFAVDAWLQGGRVVLDPGVIVKHLDLATGGIGETRGAGWYRKYTEDLRHYYREHLDKVRVASNGVVSIRFKKFGIEDRGTL